MRKHAILDNNHVIKIMDLNDELYKKEASCYQLIIDIHDLLIQPQIGWLLVGNQLIPSVNQQVSLKEMIKARIKYYQDNAPELLRDFYAENTLLGITAAQSNQMFSDYQDVLTRIREGAWPTALYCLSQKEPSGFVSQEMLDNWYNLINSRMI